LTERSRRSYASYIRKWFHFLARSAKKSLGCWPKYNSAVIKPFKAAVLFREQNRAKAKATKARAAYDQHVAAHGCTPKELPERKGPAREEVRPAKRKRA
jgi:hypothetical protein